MDGEFLDLVLGDNDLIDDVEMSDNELENELKSLNENTNHPAITKIKDEQIENYVENRESVNKYKTGSQEKFQAIKKEKDRRSRPEIYDISLDMNEPKHRDYKKSNPDNYNNSARNKDVNKYCSELGIDRKRLFRHLEIDKKTDPMIVGREIAYRLQEKKMRLIGHVARVIGFTLTMEVFSETKKICKSGGLKVENEERKRTPGGIFLYILKNRGYASATQMKDIFQHENERSKEAKRRRCQIKRNKKRKYKEEAARNVEDCIDRIKGIKVEETT